MIAGKAFSALAASSVSEAHDDRDGDRAGEGSPRAGTPPELARAR